MNVATLARPALSVGRFGARPFGWVARARGWRGIVLVALECLTAAVCGAVLWWSASLRGLPDVGDPFDVGAFREESVPARDNAYVLFDRAAAMYVPPLPPEPGGARPRMGPWKPDERETAEWLDANRAAIDQFLRGADRPDALDPRSVSVEPPRTPVGAGALYPLVGLVLEEGGRREARGDAEGAWRYYRAVFRAARLVARRAPLSDRGAGARYREMALRRLPGWTEDPRTSPALLRKALDDLTAMEAIVPDDVYTVKAEYLNAIREIDKPNAAWRNDGLQGTTFQVLGLPLPAEWLGPYFQARHVLAREPERGKRVTRLVTAQWLNYFATPPSRRPAPALKLVMKPGPGQTIRCDLFPAGPAAPPAARALAPEELGRWVLTTAAARPQLFYDWTSILRFRGEEVRHHAQAVLTVASALYWRERGVRPPDDEALVGPYLKALPPGAAATDDGETPVLEAKLDR